MTSKISKLPNYRVPKKLTRASILKFRSFNVATRRLGILKSSYSREARTRYEKHMVRDPLLRKLYFAWKFRSPIVTVRTGDHLLLVTNFCVEMYATHNDEWVEVVSNALDTYFDSMREMRMEGNPRWISFIEFVSDFHYWEMLSKEYEIHEPVTLYPSSDLLLNVRGEGECAIELAQRAGRPEFAKAITNPTRRKDVGLPELPPCEDSLAERIDKLNKRGPKADAS